MIPLEPPVLPSGPYILGSSGPKGLEATIKAGELIQEPRQLLLVTLQHAKAESNKLPRTERAERFRRMGIAQTTEESIKRGTLICLWEQKPDKASLKSSCIADSHVSPYTSSSLFL